jgi:hypothetical protein
MADDSLPCKDATADVFRRLKSIILLHEHCSTVAETLSSRAVYTPAAAAAAAGEAIGETTTPKMTDSHQQTGLRASFRVCETDCVRVSV